MEMKKYLSGAVFVILFSSVCAEGPLTTKDKVKNFYNENKTAIVATGASVTAAAATFAAVVLGCNYNTIVGKNHLRNFEETNDDINNLKARNTEINNVELKKDGLDKAVKAKLNKEIKVNERKIELLAAKLFIDVEFAKQDAKLADSASEEESTKNPVEESTES